jgi:hypothetical protein
MPIKSLPSLVQLNSEVSFFNLFTEMDDTSIDESKGMSYILLLYLDIDTVSSRIFFMKLGGLKIVVYIFMIFMSY